MRKIIFLTINILIISFSQTYAQGRYNGFVVTNENDTLYGVIEVGNAALQTVRVTFTDYEVHEEVVLEPFQIKSYYANSQVFQSKIYDVDESMDYGYAVFMEELSSGSFNLYKYWNNQRKRFELLLENSSKEMVLITKAKFSQQMVEYFGDNDLLKAKILRGVYKYKNASKAVNEYNTWKEEQLEDAQSANKTNG